MSTGFTNLNNGSGVVETDANGYLLNFKDWNQQIAKAIAEVEHIQLTDAHWDVINFLRDHYEKYNHSANVRLLVKLLTKAWGPEKGGKEHLYQLFPKGPSRQGCKIAGLPLPLDCIDWEELQKV